ncbi:uncharacterized protein L969DRAFT_43606 [Mixia osmundae IAM 14324]|uniref:Uncharacterized protein n=1 Tax=Mixia osmundae (strain CBS 9802 / IAM 14324 / JCM 22182 / KY 12970) TaxID=764103 RepID=G7DZW4_MIXOS|nr:uncharacterized protein L969DRAFT_43606 [Mixia osmundae IAM 14324]KEI42117.1 hypothetical protein L969DRAFT_43606 [Mixia osmundae IAM 14324]GAA96124.1 hypothetical protein E5Q_02785 [Mixia osmundae IAM 14324]
MSRCRDRTEAWRHSHDGCRCLGLRYAALDWLDSRSVPSTDQPRRPVVTRTMSTKGADGRQRPKLPPPSNVFNNWWFTYTGGFSFSMYEPWEMISFHIFVILLFGLLTYATVAYLPSHIRVISQRAMYYLYGEGQGIVSI